MLIVSFLRVVNLKKGRRVGKKVNVNNIKLINVMIVLGRGSKSKI